MSSIADIAGVLQWGWNKLPRWLRHRVLRVWCWTKRRNELIDDLLDLLRRLEVVEAELQGLSKLKEIAQDTSREYERQVRAVGDVVKHSHEKPVLPRLKKLLAA